MNADLVNAKVCMSTPTAVMQAVRLVTVERCKLDQLGRMGPGSVVSLQQKSKFPQLQEALQSLPAGLPDQLLFVQTSRGAFTKDACGAHLIHFRAADRTQFTGNFKVHVHRASTRCGSPASHSSVRQPPLAAAADGAG
jgi:hypothetical protein